MQVNSNNSEKIGKTQDLEFIEPITKRYLMVINIRSTCDEKGDRYLDPLWAKDLTEHFRYLKNFTIATLCQQETSPGNAIVVTREPSFSNVKADIVHSCVAGWPIPMGWLVTPIALIQGNFYVLAVESAPWRLAPGTT